MRTDPDPKLLSAMDEIKSILKKHDITASVILQSESAAEHLFHPFASWSCAHNSGNEFLNVKASKDEKCRVELTTGMFMTFSSLLELHKGWSDKVCVMLSDHFQITHIERRIR